MSYLPQLKCRPHRVEQCPICISNARETKHDTERTNVDALAAAAGIYLDNLVGSAIVNAGQLQTFRRLVLEDAARQILAEPWPVMTTRSAAGIIRSLKRG